MIRCYVYVIGKVKLSCVDSVSSLIIPFDSGSSVIFVFIHLVLLCFVLCSISFRLLSIKVATKCNVMVTICCYGRVTAQVCCGVCLIIIIIITVFVKHFFSIQHKVLYISENGFPKNRHSAIKDNTILQIK